MTDLVHSALPTTGTPPRRVESGQVRAPATRARPCRCHHRLTKAGAPTLGAAAIRRCWILAPARSPA
nr:hypothetical protein [Acetobacter papayae]